MVYAKRCVIARAHRLRKERVGWIRAGGVDPQAGEGLHGGGDNLNLFTSNAAAFAGVGVEAGHRQPWLLDPEIASQRVSRHQTGIDDRLKAQHRRDLGEWGVDGHQGDTKVPSYQHHDRPTGAFEAFVGGEFAKELGVTWKLETGFVERGS